MFASISYYLLILFEYMIINIINVIIPIEAHATPSRVYCLLLRKLKFSSSTDSFILLQPVAYGVA